MPDGPAYSDASDWHQPQYYQTIQTGSLTDAEGLQSLVARDSLGISLWGFSAIMGAPNYSQWANFPRGPDWSDANGWNQPQYYETIQCATAVSGAEQNLIGRAPDNDPNGSGIQVWGFQGDAADPTSGVWTKLPPGPPWTDVKGWNQPQFYQTIQCADVDGNGGEHSRSCSGKAPPEWKCGSSISIPAAPPTIPG